MRRWSKEEARKMAQQLHGERIKSLDQCSLINHCRQHANVQSLSDRQVTEIARLFNVYVLVPSHPFYLNVGEYHESN